jgi:carboxymethylenebutenolidase
MIHREIPIETPDGACPTHVFEPDGAGPWPGVIVYMDAFGIRPAILDIGARISAAGYYTLVPNIFHRIEFNALDPRTAFSDPATRADLMGRVLPSAKPENAMRDTEALLGHLASQPTVCHERIGTTGYCMGGRLSLIAAGTFGDRIAAAASYHGGNLATDAPDSPHRLAPNMKGRVYVGGAIEDAGFDDAQKERLDRALTEAGVEHTVETYQARHGWVPSDTAVHDPVEAERHWKTLLTLFGATLGGTPA